MTRREMIELSICALTALAAGVSFFRGRFRKRDFSFIVANDLHYTDPEDNNWFQRLTAQMKNSAPDAEFCLLAGDLTNSGTAAQLSGLRDAFDALEIPVWTVPGNHDYLGHIYGSCNAYEEVFPGRRNYWFKHGGWQFVGLDSCQGTSFHDISIERAALNWLDEELPSLDNNAPTVLFTHFPLGHGVKWRLLNGDELLARFDKFDLRAVFSGHWHGLSESRYRNARLLTNRCCGRKAVNLDGSLEKGWLVCKVVNGQLAYRFVSLT